MAIEAIKHGKAVHLEKPVAMNYAEFENMYRLQQETGVVVMPALNNRFTKESRYTKRLVESGMLGEIYFAKCGWQRRGGLPFTGWYGDKTISGGGALIDLGVHYIDLVMHFMGFPEVRSVSASCYCKFGGREQAQTYAYMGRQIQENMVFNVDDLATGRILLKNDASIQFEISWASNIKKERVFYELYGTKGGIRFECDFDTPTIYEVYTVCEGMLTDLTPQITPLASDKNEFEEFVDCVCNHRLSQVSVLENAGEMMKIVDAIYASSEQKKEICF